MRNTTIRSRLLTILLCAALVLVSGCSSTPEDGPSASGGNGGTGASETAAATGRYLEERLAMPAALNYVMLLEEDADGDLVLFGALHGADENGSPWGLWRSADGGASWTAQSPDWLDELVQMQASLQIAALAPDGGFYFYYVVYNEEGYESGEGESETSPPGEAVPEDEGGEPGGDAEADDAVDIVGGSIDDIMTSYTPPPGFFVHAGPDGLTEMPYTLPTNDWGYTGDSALVADNGDLLYLNGYELQQLDGETGAERFRYSPDNYLAPGYLSSAHGKVAIYDSGNIAFFDLETGMRAGEVKISTDEGAQAEGTQVIIVNEYIGNKALAMDPGDPDAVYFALDSGLYRAVMDSPVIERLIDGELTSLSMPSTSISRLISRADGSFLVYVGDQTMLRYTFDPDAPTAPSTELRVYSLEENRSVRQFAGMYQLQNPDVKVSYSVGMPEGSAITASDALRTLSTELLGGEGPDILVLDGLPVDSYIRQGALADLRELYAEVSPALLENVASVYRQEDGAVYAIPARFSVPTMLAPASAAQSLGSITELVDWAETLPTFSLANASKRILLAELYPLLCESWFDGEGVLDREAFADSLALVDRLADAVENSGGSALDSGEQDVGANSMFNAVFFASGHLNLALNEITSLSELEQAYSALEIRPGVFTPTPDIQGRRVFLPGSVLGINAGSAQWELAMDFLLLALGEEAQGTDVGDGMPVHRAALLAGTESPYDGDFSAGLYTIGFAGGWGDEDDPDYDPDAESEIAYSGTLTIHWPSEAFFEEYIGALEKLQPVAVDEVVRSIALEEAEAYFAGSATLEGAVSGLASKVELYLSERR